MSEKLTYKVRLKGLDGKGYVESFESLKKDLENRSHQRQVGGG